MAAVIITGAALLFAASPASATYEGENGRIAFRQILTPGYDRGEDYDHGALFTIRPNGTGLVQLTHPPKNVVHSGPDWSPNGHWIAFQRRTGDKADWRLFRIRRDGTDRQNLSKKSCQPEGCFAEFTPAWSPDGHRIAYIHAAEAEGSNVMYVMRADGTHAHPIVRPPDGYGDFCPAWAPGGRRVVFERFSRSRQRSAVFIIRTDGTHERRLTPWRMDAGEFPDWSPHGRWIMFLNHSENGAPSTIWLIRPNAERMHRITTSQGGTVTWFAGSFSPDGKLITAGRSDWQQGGERADVYVLNKQGLVLRNVTQSVRWDEIPDWGPRP